MKITKTYEYKRGMVEFFIRFLCRRVECRKDVLAWGTPGHPFRQVRGSWLS
jgi:hypothetical protein